MSTLTNLDYLLIAARTNNTQELNRTLCPDERKRRLKLELVLKKTQEQIKELRAVLQEFDK